MERPKPAQIRRVVNRHKGKIKTSDAKSFYRSTKLSFALASLELDKKNGLLCIKAYNWYWCREELSNCMMYARKNKKSYATAETATTILLRNACFNNLSSSIRVLNFFERKAGWGLSFVAPTDLPDVTFLVGSRYWCETTLHFSLFLLLIRIFSIYPAVPGQRTTTYLKERARKLSSKDCSYLKDLLDTHEDYLHIVMKHRVDLIGDTAVSQDMMEEGVNFLTEMARFVSQLKSKFQGHELEIRMNMLKENHISLEDITLLEDYYEKNQNFSEHDKLYDGFISSANFDLVLSLAKLLKKYKGKRVSL